MSDKTLNESPRLYTHDYGAAIAKAVEWLGDRYLLAKPIALPPRTRRPAYPVSVSCPSENALPTPGERP